jgi:3-mercaptopyruvate sulfurtransferase SseA
VALRLKRNGITRIRPLAGGLHLWMTREYPIEDLKPAHAKGLS